MEMTDYNKYIQDTIQLLNSAQINIMNLSHKKRKRTLDLENRMNEIINANASEIFFKILDEWKTLLMTGGEFDEFNGFELQAHANG